LTAISFTGTNPTVGASTDTWGTTINTGLTQIKADLDMLNATPTTTILGRVTGGTGEVERLTAAQATTIPNPVVGATQSTGGTKGMVPAASAGDQHKVLTGAGTFQVGYGRAFGCVIVNTCINGSQPTLTAAMNVASVSTLTVSASIASCIITFTNALPNATYAVHGNANGSISGVAYDRTTTTATLYWDTTGAVNTAISVSGFL